MESIDRMRAHTSDAINRQIDRAIESRLHDYVIRARAERREELDREKYARSDFDSPQSGVRADVALQAVNA